MENSTKYQLIAKGERHKHGFGNCRVYDLEAQTHEEAEKEARILLYGDSKKWRVSWHKRWQQERVVRVDLDPGDNIRLHTDILLDGEYCEVQNAWIVEVREHFDIPTLRQEIDDFRETNRHKLEGDPEYQEYLKLKSKFG